MKIFNWMQSKLSGRQGSNKPSGLSVNHQIGRQEARKEEFSDWPHGLLAIGTFGNNNLKEESSQSTDNYAQDHDEEDPSSSLELLEEHFTPEEVGKLQKELTKLLSRKPAVSNNNESESTTGESSSNNLLPLDKFLNCPSSLEVDRTYCTQFCDDLDDDGDKDNHHYNLPPTTSTVILSKGKDVCFDSKDHHYNANNAIKKRSVTFLLKKMFACTSGFAPAPSLRDPLPESRMEKLLRAILHKKIYQQSSTPAASMKKYLENRYKAAKDRKEDNDDLPEKPKDGSKWVNTDSEYIVLEI
ncbi:protein DEEPER ROOTING 1-like [Macadamia integrifolia]|uniref:protein DEEPER ROOTING 1-like n=1 Tax=Macadamia integrifolia TaxID=60698 RepID=UPI001C4EF549|nr:protein DEEPER ROOTING 1-like [Macadamia integrifolia]